MKIGIDVSQHQGKIDWEKVKNKIDFAILRIGWVGNKNNHTIDKYFEYNYNECKRLNIPVGGYIYSYSNNEISAQSGGKFINNIIANKIFELPLFLDLEDKSICDIAKLNFNIIIDSFFKEIKNNKKGVYANKFWFENKLDYSYISSNYYIWIAQYNSVCRFNKEYDIWQNKSNGKIDGIKGNVDMNLLKNEYLLTINGLQIAKICYNNLDDLKVMIEYNFEQFWVDRNFKICYNNENDNKLMIETSGKQFWIHKNNIKINSNSEGVII